MIGEGGGPVKVKVTQQGEGEQAVYEKKEGRA